MPTMPRLGARTQSMLQVHMAYPAARLAPRERIEHVREVITHPVRHVRQGWAPQGLLRGFACSAGTALALGAALPILGVSVGGATAATVCALGLAAVVAGTLMTLYAATNLGRRHLLARAEVFYGSYAAMGLSLAPLVALGPAAWATAAGATMVGCTLGMGAYLASIRRTPTGPGLTGSVLMLSACMVLGPTGWLMGGGIAAAAALSESICAAGLTMALSSLALWLARTLQSGAPTEFADSLQMRQQVVDRSRLDGVAMGAGRATIFNVADGFKVLARDLQQRLEQAGGIFTGWDGLCVATLYGPPGSGKTYSAAGLAQSLNAGFVSCDNASLSSENVPGAPVAAINLVTLLMESQIKAAREDRPYVVFIDEVDSFLPQADGADDISSRNRSFGFVLLLNALALLARSKTHLVVLMATNYPREIAPLLKLMSAREPIWLGPPDRKELGKMVMSQVASLQNALAMRKIPQTDLSAHPKLAGHIDRLSELGITGRDLGLLQRQALQACVLEHLRRNPLDTRPIDDVAMEAMEEALKTLERKGSQSAQNEAYRSAAHEPSTEAVEKMMRDYGLQHLDPFQILRELGEQLINTYDPTNAELGILMSRLQLTLMQYGLVYLGQKLQQPRRQELTDVRPDAGTQLFDRERAQGSIKLIRKMMSDTIRQGFTAAISQ